MGLLGLFQADIGSTNKQQQIEAAMQREDHGRMKRLIGDSVGEILRAGLTKQELATLEAMKEKHGDLLRQTISEAFGRDWVSGGEPNLSNAMEEVLSAARRAVKGYGRRAGWGSACQQGWRTRPRQ